MPDAVVRNAENAIELLGDRRFTGEEHQDEVAFAVTLDVIRQAALVPLTRSRDFAAVVLDQLAELGDDLLDLFFGKGGRNDE